MYSNCLYSVEAFAHKKNSNSPSKFFFANVKPVLNVTYLVVGILYYVLHPSISIFIRKRNTQDLSFMQRNCLVIEPLTKEKVQKKHQHTKNKCVKAAMPIFLLSHKRNPVLLCSYIHLPSPILLTFCQQLGNAELRPFSHICLFFVDSCLGYPQWLGFRFAWHLW